MTKSLTSLLILLTVAVLAQPTASDLQKIDRVIGIQERAMLDEYLTFLEIPNHARDEAGIRANAEFISDMMRRRGIHTQRLRSSTPGTPDAIYGEVITPGAMETIVFYAHYDGQPVNPEKWNAALKPYGPVIMDDALEKGGKPVDLPAMGQPVPKDWRIHCRSSSDDKAGVMAILNAYDVLVRAGIKPKVNIKFFFEGEEEIGSLHLGEILENHRELLKADFWIIADGPIHPSGAPKVDLGVRGDVNIHLRVFGPKRPLHSGHYGNWAPNPCLLMAQLLAGMKDEQGRVTIKGYHDDVIRFSQAEQEAFARMPSMDEILKKDLGIHTTDHPGMSLYQTLEWPSLNINGIRCADAGDQASNVIPTEALATLDLRQVAGTDYLKQVDRIREHIRLQGYLVLDRHPTDEERLEHARIAMVTVGNGGYNAQRTPLDLPVAQRVVAAVQATTSQHVLVQPTSGGSLPLYLFERILQAKVIGIPMVNHDNNQHAENENVRIGHLWDAMRRITGIMMLSPAEGRKQIRNKR